MAYEPPADLLKLKQLQLEADARCEQLAAALPSNVAVLALEAERDEEGIAALIEARTERLALVEAINRHSWWSSVEDRHDAWVALLKASQG